MEPTWHDGLSRKALVELVEGLLLAMDKSVPRLDAIAHHLSLMSQQGEEMEVLGGISDQVADIGSFAAGHLNRHTLCCQGIDDFVIAVDNRCECCRIDPVGVAADGIGNLEIIDRTDTEQIVRIHDQGVLGNAPVPGGIFGLLGHQVGHGRFRPRTIGMDGTAILRITSQIGNDLAEGPWEKAFRLPGYGFFDIVFGRRDAA